MKVSSKSLLTPTFLKIVVIFFFCFRKSHRKLFALISYHISNEFLVPETKFRSIELFQVVSMGRRRLSANFQLLFRLIKALVFLTLLSVFIILIALPHMTLRDIIVCILAFMPTGWGLLLVSELFFSPFMCPIYNFLLAFNFSSLFNSSCSDLVYS